MRSLVLYCLHLFSDCGGIRAEGKCSGWSTESPPPQHGRKPERPLPAALLHYTKSSSFQGAEIISFFLNVMCIFFLFNVLLVAEFQHIYKFFF